MLRCAQHDRAPCFSFLARRWRLTWQTAEPITLPLAWFPRLQHGTSEEWANWQQIGGGQGVHWPDLNEDISVESLLAGRQSGESHESLRRWLDARNGD